MMSMFLPATAFHPHIAGACLRRSCRVRTSLSAFRGGATYPPHHDLSCLYRRCAGDGAGGPPQRIRVIRSLQPIEDALICRDCREPRPPASDSFDPARFTGATLHRSCGHNADTSRFPSRADASMCLILLVGAPGL